MARIAVPPQTAYEQDAPDEGLRPGGLCAAPRFASALLEREFSEHLGPQVVVWSAVFHSVAAALAAVGVVWASLVAPPGSTGGVRAASLANRGGLVLVQLALALLWSTARALRRRGRRVELWSAASAGAVCAATLWANPFHSSVLLGADAASAAELWGDWVVAAEGSVVLGVAALVVGFGASVPVRSGYWPIVPLSALASYGTLLAAVGAQDTVGTSAFRALVLALLWAVFSLRFRTTELHMRAAWLRARMPSKVKPIVEEEGEEQVVEKRDTAGLSANAYDITFRLSDTCSLTRTSKAVHAAFFGQAATGLSFTRFVACDDRLRFQEMLDAVAALDIAATLSCSLVLAQGPVQVDLAAMKLSAADGGGFLVGLRIMHEQPQPQPSSPSTSRSASREEGGFSGIVPQPSSDRPPLAPPTPPGAATPESEGSNAEVLSSSDSRRTNEFLRLTSGSRGSNDRLTNEFRLTPHEGRPTHESRPTYEGRQTNESFGREAPHMGASPVAFDGPDRLSGRSFVSSRSTPRRAGSWMQSVLSERSWLGGQDQLWFSSSTDGRPTHEGRLTNVSYTNEEDRLSHSSRSRSCTVAQRMFTMMRHQTTAAGTQTEPGPTSVTTATNTNIVMDGLSFRCMNCSKPPKKPRYYSPDTCAPVVPGPEAQALIAKLDRKKRVRRDGHEAQQDAPRAEGDVHVFSGPDFNGRWEVIVRDGDDAPNEWLQRFIIFNGKVLLGDGSGALLAQVGDGYGPILLKGGELRLTSEGRLIRTGQSGVELEFYMMWECDEPPSILG